MNRWTRTAVISTYNYTRRRYLSTHQNQITRVEKIVRDSIESTGPIPLANYISLALSHPTHGYYTNLSNPVFGPKGDFVTSPEISQLFGELIAIWHISRWQASGCPKRIRVLELGPGRGTLMADCVRVWNQFPQVREALERGEVRFVEVSEGLKKMQMDTLTSQFGSLNLGTEEKQTGLSTRWHWHSSIEDAQEASSESLDGDTFTIAIAHELFDALPIHALERRDTGWHELLVTTEPDPTATTVIKASTLDKTLPPLRLAVSPSPTAHSRLLGALSPRFNSLPIGTRIEVSPASFKLAKQLADYINDPRGSGGSGLVVDYGKDSWSGGSLRAFKKHKLIENIFETPGECDLTANVDFALLKEAINDTATTHGPITQRDFLVNMGIFTRASRIQPSPSAGSSQKMGVVKGAEINQTVMQAVMRLIDPTGMGTQYQFMGITGTGLREKQADGDVVWPFVNGTQADPK